MSDRMKIDLFQKLMKADSGEGELLAAIRNLMAVQDPESLSQSIKTAPPAFGSWSGWSY